MPSLSEQDYLLLTSMEQWFETARDEIEDICAWRKAPQKKTTPWRAPEHFFRDTQSVTAGITSQYPHLDTSAITRTFQVVRQWHQEHNADRLPSNAALEGLVEDAAIVFVAIRQSAYDRSKKKHGANRNGQADTKTDKLPENGDVIRLARMIGRELPKGRTKIDIALDFTEGNERRANSLLRSLRRYPALKM